MYLQKKVTHLVGHGLVEFMARKFLCEKNKLEAPLVPPAYICVSKI